jgi:hypothetical protein
VILKLLIDFMPPKKTSQFSSRAVSGSKAASTNDVDSTSLVSFVDSNVAAGEIVIDSRHTVATKDGYTSCMRGILDYYQKHSSFSHLVEPDPDENAKLKNRLVLPLPFNPVKSLFGFLATKRMADNKRAAKTSKGKTKKKSKQSRGHQSKSDDSVDSDDDDDNDDEDSADDQEDSSASASSAAPTDPSQIQRYVDSRPEDEATTLLAGGINDDNTVVTEEEQVIFGEACTSELKCLHNINFRTMSRSHMQNHLSSLKMAYLNRKVVFAAPDVQEGDINMLEWLGMFVKAYNRIIGDKKERGVMKLGEGKNAVLPQGYRKLNQKLLTFTPPPGSKLNKNSGIFGWVCSSMQWQNICRIETLDRFHETHFDWVMDSLQLELVRTKKDQGATGKGKKRKLYVNIFDPAVCGVLPIAVWALLKESPACNTAGEKFLDGKDQKARYRKLLMLVRASQSKLLCCCCFVVVLFEIRL